MQRFSLNTPFCSNQDTRRNTATDTDNGMGTTFHYRDVVEQKACPFDFSVYRQLVLQSLIQHGKLEEESSQQRTLLEQFSQEFHDGAKTCLKQVTVIQNPHQNDKVEICAMQDETVNGNDHGDDAYQINLDMLKAIVEGQRKKSLHAIPHEKVRNRSNTAGVNYAAYGNRFAVAWYMNGVRSTKYFSINKHGLEGAYRKAFELRQKMIEEGARIKHSSVPDHFFKQRKRPGTTGVYYNRHRKCWTAHWPNEQLKGKKFTKTFAVGEHGANEAYMKAFLYREQKMREIAVKRSQILPQDMVKC